MNISLTPDTYTPAVDNNGNYVDCKPIIHHGIYCPCSNRKDKIYENASKFTAHCKTKMHQRWLINLNNNKANYYVELLECKATLVEQQKIIANLDNQLQQKSSTIDYLTKQLVSSNTTVVTDLLDM